MSVVALLASLILPTAHAQVPSVAEWKVVETEHYRVHYPAPAEAWTLRQVERMESVRERVAEEVGWTPAFKMQVLVQDPFSEPNGAVLPVGKAPRMVLWTSPPGADSVIGTYRDWGELLVTHEDTHAVHLMRSPRGLSGQVMYWLFRLTPVTLKSPRWVIEGYATVVEGRLTGSGRPNGAYRATLLRRLAQQGALPAYGELSASERWAGMGYAYLVGSAYLEWLEQRAGEGSLRDLWARMTARKVRNFEQAFEGVFGDKPWVLYNRFTAELTADAMKAEGADWDRSTLWMDTSWSTGAPAVSPDGSRLAVVLSAKDQPPVLRVWKTEVSQDDQRKRANQIEEILKRDPDDVGPVDPRHAPHETVATLSDRTHTPRSPRWVDSDTLVYDAGRFDSYRQYRRDLFTWNVETGKVRRVTDLADVRDPDPHPDGTRAVVVQGQWGRTGLSTVDLQTGEVTPLTPRSVDVVVDQPRYSPDGGRLLFLEHRAGDGHGFQPVVRDLAADTQVALPVPEGATAVHAAWDGEHVIASLALDGRVDLWRLGVDAAPERMSADGAAFAPAPSEDGVYFLQLQADGLEVHFLEKDAVHPPPEDGIGLAGPAHTGPADVPALSSATPQPMGLGKLEPRLLMGGMVGQRASNFEVGLRLGDLVGRNDFLINGSLGDRGGVTGGTLWWANRTLPADLEVRSWVAREGFSDPWWVGAGLSLDSEGGRSAHWGEARAGAWLEIGTDGNERGEAWAELYGEVVEPRTRWFRAWSGGRASAGQAAGETVSLAEASSGFALGRSWTISTDYALGVARGQGFSLGGVTTGIRPEAAQWRQLRNGWSAPDTATGTVHDRMRWALGSGGVDLYVERRRVWTGLGVTPFSLGGLRILQSIDAQGFARIPGLDVEIGVGCVFEENGRTPDRACRKLDHYRSWSGLVWRP